MFSIPLLLFCAISKALSSPAIHLYQCDSGDDACVTKAVKVAYPLVLEANEDVGAEDLDPMFQTEIKAHLSILKFNLFNSTITGFKSCAVQNAQYSEEPLTLQIDLLCPGFSLKGMYDINGRLIVLPVEGNGDYRLITKKYRLVVNMELKKISGKDGKSYMTVKNFKAEAEPLESIIFDLRNLFNGQKDLAETVLKFANENWKEVANEVQEPVFLANIKKIVKNANKYLKNIPIDEYIVQ